MSRKILIIDDELDLLDIMEEALKYEGFEVVTSPVGAACQTLIREQLVDLLMIDYLLTGKNGGEICRELKSCPEFASLPVIIFSAHPKASNSVEKYGCDLYIPKPFDLAYIVDQLSLLLHCSNNRYFSQQLQ